MTDFNKNSVYSSDVTQKVGEFYRNRLSACMKQVSVNLVTCVNTFEYCVLVQNFILHMTKFIIENYQAVIPFIPEGDSWIYKTYTHDINFLKSLIKILDDKLIEFKGEKKQ